MQQIGLVLEGGGMRGVYTAGVLDFFMDSNIYFPYVIGVSMGACNAASYISRQRGRNPKVVIDYIGDPKYLSFKNYLKEKSLFGMDFIFNEIPNKLEPFDYTAFFNSPQRFLAGATDCKTGETVYFEKQPGEDMLTVLKASSSLPFVSPIVNYKGFELVDGGVTDPLPIKKALQDGNSRNVVVLTRNQGYRKKPFGAKLLARRAYSRYPKLVQALLSRHEEYNKSLDRIEQLEAEGKVFIIRPERPLKVGRMEKKADKLRELYQQGYEEARASYPGLQKWLGQ